MTKDEKGVKPCLGSKVLANYANAVKAIYYTTLTLQITDFIDFFNRLIADFIELIN